MRGKKSVNVWEISGFLFIDWTVLCYRTENRSLQFVAGPSTLLDDMSRNLAHFLFHSIALYGRVPAPIWDILWAPCDMICDCKGVIGNWCMNTPSQLNHFLKRLLCKISFCAALPLYLISINATLHPIAVTIFIHTLSILNIIEHSSLNFRCDMDITSNLLQ